MYTNSEIVPAKPKAMAHFQASDFRLALRSLKVLYNKSSWLSYSPRKDMLNILMSSAGWLFADNTEYHVIQEFLWLHF